MCVVDVPLIKYHLLAADLFRNGQVRPCNAEGHFKKDYISQLIGHSEHLKCYSPSQFNEKKTGDVCFVTFEGTNFCT